eukprot:TRINITY_DN6690_c0_g1_i1.p1 TRINITY_DN6690_c0_g1~~TRINITY_DN6690_c0_g1_i1.p1  ORF type:complete len:443 (+),score=54.28 TRINITY_DN6690_c0_g1_i1:48-1376(+)
MHDNESSPGQKKKLKPNRLEYTGKMILAPMVKVGTLPMRLLALEYGADIVYTEEIIDWKLLNSNRVENKLLGTVDYIDKTDNTLVFRTCPQERGHLVLQIGTSDGDRAARVAKMVEQDIDGIDVNMGCPKSFSLKGGMGAALLTKPDKILDILTKLKASVSIPVTCKIRVFSDVAKSVELVKMIETTGVAAVGVHGRTKDQRPNDENNVDAIKQIVAAVNVPIIANGGSSNNRNSPINTYQGIRQFWKESTASSVMIARAAEWNVSVFRDAEKLVDIMTVIHQYLAIAIHYDYPFLIVKYCVQQMLGSMQSETELGKKFLESATMGDLCRVFDIEDAYRERQKELGLNNIPDHVYSARIDQNDRNSKPLVEGLCVEEKFCPFIRAHYGPDNSNDLPKSRLLNYTRQKQIEAPAYKVYQDDKKIPVYCVSAGLVLQFIVLGEE